MSGERGLADDSDYITREDIGKLISQEFLRFDPEYDEKRKPLKDRVKELSKQLDELQKAGHDLWCSDQIRNQTKWLLNYRADWGLLTQKIAQLEQSLKNLDQGELKQQADGSWGPCIDEPYRKLEPTVDQLQSAELVEAEVKPLAFMSRYSDPLALQDYLWSLQVSDIAKTGLNHRDELGAVETAFSQLIYKDDLRSLLDSGNLGFQVTDALENAYGDFMHQTQHPRTGYWGPWYRVNGQLLMVQDLSYTFHHIHFRGGNVANWDHIVDTTLRIRELTYPNGWKPQMSGGPKYSDHHNYDVVQIFFSGWPYMSQLLKKPAREAMYDMLNWCLTESVQGDGFRNGDDAFEALYFGVRFLDRVGYWDSAKRFWSRTPLHTPTGLPSPLELAKRLTEGLRNLGVKSERGETIKNILRIATYATEDQPSPVVAHRRGTQYNALCC